MVAIAVGVILAGSLAIGFQAAAAVGTRGGDRAIAAFTALVILAALVMVAVGLVSPLLMP